MRPGLFMLTFMANALKSGDHVVVEPCKHSSLLLSVGNMASTGFHFIPALSCLFLIGSCLCTHTVLMCIEGTVCRCFFPLQFLPCDPFWPQKTAFGSRSTTIPCCTVDRSTVSSIVGFHFLHCTQVKLFPDGAVQRGRELASVADPS